jgi:hypothetical protein
MMDLTNFFDSDLRAAMFYFVLLVLIIFLYRYELNNKLKSGASLTNYDKYYCRSSMKSIFLIIVSFIATIIYFSQAIKKK